jgi:hypothetical protein
VSRAPASFEVLEEKKALKAGRCSPHPHQGRERRQNRAEGTTGYMKRGIYVEQNEQRKTLEHLPLLDSLFIKVSKGQIIKRW